ncbi:hypothetical protein ACVJGD_007926 [Bradyrhizobium sp. USDA 10063]
MFMRTTVVFPQIQQHLEQPNNDRDIMPLNPDGS